MKDSVRIGCWAAFWGDTDRAIGRLLTVPDLDYLISDYLAEITMALLSRARAKDPNRGYVADAVAAIVPHLATIRTRGIKVVTNAGGLNPLACASTIRRAVESARLPLKVAAVLGDDLLPRAEEILALDPRDMFTGEPLPSRLASINVYIGARAIADALAAGADIVVTGRCVDAAVVLGPLMHELGWSDTDYDLLSAGSLAGHIIECGPQCTGGTYTDWQDVPGWDDIGYPIATVSRTGITEISKPLGTGGLVTTATVGEQILYEIGDPGAYVLPDVICDWRGTSTEQIDRDRVRVTGARGSPPTTSYKATCAAGDGFRVMTTAMFAGLDAGGRARKAADAIIARSIRLMREAGFAPPRETSVEVVGGGDGSLAPRDDHASEVVVKIGLKHRDRDALEIFAREFAPMALVAQGMTGLFAGRPRVAPVFNVYHLLIDKAGVPISVDFGDRTQPVAVAPGSPTAVTATPELADPPDVPEADSMEVPLRRIAWARSGDKGNKANIGLIARRPEFFDVLKNQVTTRRVATRFGPYLKGSVKRWELEGQHALNFVLDGVLGGTGGTSSLRYDPQGKSYAAMLLALPVRVPPAWEHNGWLAPASGVSE
jgi:hypothetical protein